MGYGGWEVKTHCGLPRLRTSCGKETQDVWIQRAICSVSAGPRGNTDYQEVNRREKPPDSRVHRAKPSEHRENAIPPCAFVPLSIRYIPHFSAGK